MEDILVAIFQFLFEFILEVLSYGSFDWPSTNRSGREPDSIVYSCFLWFCGGCLLGGASLLVFRHTLIAIPPLRVANLVLAPLASGFLALVIAGLRAPKYTFIVPRNHFWQAFWFTLGLTLIRFMYATRA